MLPGFPTVVNMGVHGVHVGMGSRTCGWELGLLRELA